MYKRYTCLKTKINKEDLSYCNILFDNNELLVIDQDEIADFHFTFYDKLIKRDQGIHPFVKEGLIKLEYNNEEYYLCEEKNILAVVEE